MRSLFYYFLVLILLKFFFLCTLLEKSAIINADEVNKENELGKDSKLFRVENFATKFDYLNKRNGVLQFRKLQELKEKNVDKENSKSKQNMNTINYYKLINNTKNDDLVSKASSVNYRQLDSPLLTSSSSGILTSYVPQAIASLSNRVEEGKHMIGSAVMKRVENGKEIQEDFHKTAQTVRNAAADILDNTITPVISGSSTNSGGALGGADLSFITQNAFNKNDYPVSLSPLNRHNSVIGNLNSLPFPYEKLVELSGNQNTHRSFSTIKNENIFFSPPPPPPPFPLSAAATFHRGYLPSIEHIGEIPTLPSSLSSTASSSPFIKNSHVGGILSRLDGDKMHLLGASRKNVSTAGEAIVDIVRNGIVDNDKEKPNSSKSSHNIMKNDVNIPLEYAALLMSEVHRGGGGEGLNMPPVGLYGEAIPPYFFLNADFVEQKKNNEKNRKDNNNNNNNNNA